MLRHLDTHNCPLSRWPGIRTIVPSTPQRHAPSRRILTTTAPPHVAPRPHGCSCLLSQTSSSASRRRSTIPILTTCGPIYLRRFCPYLPPPDVHAPRAPSRTYPRRSAHPLPTTGLASYLTTPHHSRQTYQVSPPQNPPPRPTRPIHPPHPTLHASPPQLKKNPQLWITVTAVFNVIFLIELLMNWYGSVWCAAALQPKLESEHQPSIYPRHSHPTPSPVPPRHPSPPHPLTSSPLHPHAHPPLLLTPQVQELFPWRLEHFRFAHRLSRHCLAHRARLRH